MKRSIVVSCVLAPSALVLAGPAARAADPATETPATEIPATETIVLLRHGEKPPAGLGQLDCQGLNRALARLFGRPAAIFAPNPASPVWDEGGVFDYVRPLATIEPTAIALGMPVDASVGFTDIEGLQRRLGEPRLRQAWCSWPGSI